jgi:aminoglycoside 6-adenylyltransferase
VGVISKKRLIFKNTNLLQSPMRSAEQIKKLILDVADADARIRAVLLNGSRANPALLPDQYQDFDVVFIVTDTENFISNHQWTNVFGQRILWQLPDEMTFGKPIEEPVSFAYLILFKDGNRIDLTLFPKEKVQTDFCRESLTVVWLDKDHLFPNIPFPDSSDHFIKEPTEKEFTDTCNEFWWVSTYVAKGLVRNQMTYAKEIMETAVRPMFMKMIEWKIGTENNFTVGVGKAGKFIQQYLPSSDYKKILLTYSDHQVLNNWESLFIMTELFGSFAKTVAGKLNFLHNTDEEKNAAGYIKQLHKNRQQLH